MKRVLRWIGLGLGGIVALLLVAVAAIYGLSSYRLSRSYTLPIAAVAVPNDAASIERGRHLVVAITKCGECHGDNLAGKVFIDDPALGRIVAPNLTSGKGGLGAALDDGRWELAVRHGVSHDNRGLVVMPSEDWAQLSDQDLGAIIAYVRSLPPVDNQLPPLSVGPLGRALFVAGKLPLLAVETIDHTAARALDATPGQNVEYGHYLAVTGGCTGCHNPSLSGGPIPGGPPDWPPAANLTPSGNLGRWSEADFARALREGKRPDGSTINPVMPWKATSQMTDDEIKALYSYLLTVSPKSSGQH